MTIDEPFKPLSEGTFTYFTIQSKVTHLSPHNEPDAGLIPAKDVIDGFGKPYKSKWGGMIHEYIAEPWDGSGNDYKPKYKASSDEKHDVWAKTGGCGWWSLKYAVAAMRRLQKASENGDLNYKDSYNKVYRAVRYEFRVIKINVSKSVEVVGIKDLMDSLLGEAT